jgi:hypothetical protein
LKYLELIDALIGMSTIGIEKMVIPVSSFADFPKIKHYAISGTPLEKSWAISWTNYAI